MKNAVSNRYSQAAAPGRPKQGPTQGRSPYTMIGVQS